LKFDPAQTTGSDVTIVNKSDVNIIIVYYFAYKGGWGYHSNGRRCSCFQ